MSKEASAMKTYKGVTLIEILLGLAIIAFIIIGAITFYNSANNNSRLNAARAQVQGIISGVESLYQTRSDYAGLNTQLAIDADLVPANLVAGGAIENPWSGEYQLVGNGGTYDLTITNLPEGGCAGLATQGLLDEPNVTNMNVNGTDYTDPVAATPGAVAGDCAGGGATIVYTIE